MDSQTGPPPGRQQEIGTRLDVIRTRLRQLRERDWDAVKSHAVPASERLEAAQRHAAEAQAAAMQVLSASVSAFRSAAEAHERVASVHDKAAAAGIGDIVMHEQQATMHRAAAAADRQRAERAQSVLSSQGQAGAAAVSGEPGDGTAR